MFLSTRRLQIIPLVVQASNTCTTALRRLGLHQGIPLQAPGLQQGELVPELRRLYRGRVGLARRVGAAGRHQDSHPEQEL